jgi:hypothetical protein
MDSKCQKMPNYPNTPTRKKRRKKEENCIHKKNIKKNPSLPPYLHLHPYLPSPSLKGKLTTQPTSQPPASISSKHAKAALAHPSIYLLAEHP